VSTNVLNRGNGKMEEKNGKKMEKMEVTKIRFVQKSGNKFFKRRTRKMSSDKKSEKREMSGLYI
jgi:hypothetical protein